MRDLVLFAHIILGAALIVLPIIILIRVDKKPYFLKHISFITAGISWAELHTCKLNCNICVLHNRIFCMR